ncbi:7952_t:CDS:2, partial [Racocetra persica]
NPELQLSEQKIQSDVLNRLKSILLQQNKILKDFPNMSYPDSVREFENLFANWLLLIGEGRIAEVTPHTHDPTYIVERSILVSLNSDVDMLNTEILSQFPEEAKTYYSANSLDQSSPMYNSAYEDIYSTEFLNLLAISSLSPHVLILKVGSLIILLRNIDANQDL